MKLINNIYGSVREVKGFSKDDVLEIKNTLTEFKLKNSEPAEIEVFLKEKFPLEIVVSLSDYLESVNNFIGSYMKEKADTDTDVKHVEVYYHLKIEIIEELKLVSNNLLNLKLNCQNAQRLRKNDAYLKDFLEQVNDLLEKGNELISLLEASLSQVEKKYEDEINFWIEANKIKNLSFIFKHLPEDLRRWDEFKEFYLFLKTINQPEKKKKKKRQATFACQFSDIYQFHSKKQDGKLDFYMQLIYLLYLNNFCEENPEGFVNVIERKDIKQGLKDFLNPLVISLTKDRLENILNEISQLDEDHGLGEKKKELNLKVLLGQQISVFLPKVIELYFNGLEKKSQELVSKLGESEEFKSISKSYSEKITVLRALIIEINDTISSYHYFLKPYEEVTSPLSKIFSNITSEIDRRKEEYLYYLKTVKKERLRDKIRNYVSEKINEINELLTTYQDKTALIIREEFPQLKQIRDIIRNYDDKVQGLKAEVHQKLDMYKKKDIDIYQIIKQWEDNFNRKKQQLSFLLSTLLNKLYKNFKEVIESEDLLFDRIAEIQDQKDSFEELPLNFALSGFIVDKLTEAEIKERTSELNARINKLNQEVSLYQEELIKLEEVVETRIKIREGLLTSDVACTVCHEHIKLGKEQIIKCPFCDAIFHYLCVAFWLSKYNSCPSCQNQFLDPNNGLFDVEAISDDNLDGMDDPETAEE